MFGLEKDKKGKEKASTFDLEKEMKDPVLGRQFKTKTDLQIQKLKEALRKGEPKEEYDQMGTLLLAYVAFQKVLARTQKI